MYFKVAVLFAVIAASVAQYAAPSYAKPDEIKYPPQPYQFGYDSNDEYGNTAYRKESGDSNGRVQGSYGYKDAQGIERVVEYVADEHGYRAQVKTNEPGTENKSPADIELYANPIAVNWVPQPQRYQAAPAGGAAAAYKPQY
ncbi:cuticle protein 10.9-like [Argiope bruennichi]|uniref:Cuticle protein 16.8 like protein n=2 Tax=Araneidae TaxID=6913 RepID=A0A8T0F209_ARGBR|nr:cuticle protein 10.9-like [Argiope bruennichi]KAF8783009.1 Cuticle protein 16.8 like protein [Argiope bruennichi]